MTLEPLGMQGFFIACTLRTLAIQANNNVEEDE
jgi:hypothetical protein